MRKPSNTHDPQQTAESLGSLIKQARLVWRLLRDGRISEWTRLIPLAGLVYLLWPIDLLPDFVFPGLSQLDDLAVILLSLKLFVELCPPAIVREHVEQLTARRRKARTASKPPSGPYLDVPYRVLDHEKE
jgi:uncharacterized membrane protein YkvA (DUF1232 family)